MKITEKIKQYLNEIKHEFWKQPSQLTWGANDFVLFQNLKLFKLTPFKINKKIFVKFLRNVKFNELKTNAGENIKNISDLKKQKDDNIVYKKIALTPLGKISPIIEPSDADKKKWDGIWDF